MELAGTVALITGGASGLGLATARRVLAGGGKVALLDLPSSAGEAAAAELGDAAIFAPGDVTNPDDVSAALDAAEEIGRAHV